MKTYTKNNHSGSDTLPPLAEQNAFWMQIFEEPAPALELPMDFNRPLAKTSGRGTYQSTIEQSQTEALKNLAAKQDVTWQMLTLSLYNILLSKLSNENDIVVGTFVRDKEDGSSVKILPIRNEVNGEESFLEFLVKTKAVVMAANENQSLDYEALLELLKVEKNPNRNPLFDAFFVFNEDQQAPGNANHFNVDISLSVTEKKGQWHLNIEFDAELFLSKTIERFANYFQQIITAVLNHPAISIADIEMLSEAEKNQILFDFNNSQEAFPELNTILDLFEKQVALTPDNVALHFDDAQISYRELKEASDNLASYLLIERNIKVGDAVGVMLERELHLIPLIFGIVKAGGIYIPIDPKNPAARIETIVQESALKVIFTQNAFRDKLTCAPAKILILDELQIVFSQYKEDFVPPAIKSTDLAYIIFTSGSTGKPKGVMIEHASLSNVIQAMDKMFPLQESRSYLFKSTYTFDVSVAEIFGWFLNGGSLAILPPNLETDPDAMLKAIDKHKVSHVNIVPSMFSPIVEKLKIGGVEQLKTISYFLLGGEALSRALVEQFEALDTGVELVNAYGPTEATIYSTVFSIADLKSTIRVPIGKAIKNMSLYVIGKNNKLQPIGVPGELCVSGVPLARGYLNNRALTESKFIPNPFVPEERLYKTGDLVKWMPDGNIDYLGRIDNQVKVRGFRIELGEIESALLKLDLLKEVAVVVKEKKGDKYLVAYYISPSVVEADFLTNYLKQELPVYMVPSFFVAMDTFPLTSSGKLDRKNLPTPTFTISEAYIAPSTALEHQLVAIWADILGFEKEKIGATHSFFALGGHSLKALRLINKIAVQLNLSISFIDIFNNPTIRQLGHLLANGAAVEKDTIEQVEDRDHYPLSAPQNQMYFLNKLNANSLAYNEPKILRLKGKIDQEEITNVFNQLIARHESLRTFFTTENNVPVQKVLAKATINLEQYEANISSVPQLIKNFIRPFDLSQGPILRVALIKLEETDHILMIDMHHIIVDGVSYQVLMDDFSALMTGETLAELPNTYKDFAIWQLSSTYQNRLEEQKAFWLNEFSEETELLELPTDFSRPVNRKSEGATITFDIDAQQTAALEEIAQEQDATVYMLLLSIFTIWLEKLTNQQTITVGTPVSGRAHNDLENVVGMFVNSLAIKNELNENLNFLAHLSAVKAKTLACFDNQSFQYEALVTALGQRRDLSRNPLFDVMFSWENFEQALPEVSGLIIENIDFEDQRLQFDLTLAANRLGDRLQFKLNYAVDLFKQGTVTRFADYFKNVMSQVVSNPKVKLGAIDVLSQKEEHQLLNEFNATAGAYPRDKTALDLFEAQVALHPSNCALLFNDQELSYKEVDEKANQLAQYLLEQGAIQNSVVGLLVDRSTEMIIALLSILKAGCTYLPLDAQQPIDRTLGMLTQSKSELLLTEKDKTSKYTEHLKVIDIAAPEISECSIDKPEIEVVPQDIAYIIFTSGSTGKPKGVKVGHQALTNLIWCQSQKFQIDKTERVFQFSSIVFDASVEQIWLALANGAGLVLADKEVILNNNYFNNYLRQHKVSHLDVTPSFLESITLEKQEDLKRIVLGGEACKMDTVKKYASDYKIYNAYGPTEATVTAVMCELTNEIIAENKPLIGKPIANTQIYLLNKQLSLVPIGVTGELYIGGDGLATEYLNDEQLTREKFIGSPFIEGKKLYKTGDVARWLPNGHLEFLGRKDQQVKIRGFRIELGEIESQLNVYNGIKESAVVVKHHNEEPYLCAYYISEAEIKSLALTAHLSEHLPNYMVPAYFIPLERIPLNSSGKLNTKQLPDPEFSITKNYIGPSNDIELKLVEIWGRVLKINSEDISVNLSFFELGGHSLKVITTIGSIFQELDINLSLTDFFRFGTIQKIGEYIENEKWLKVEATHSPSSEEEFIID